MSKQRVSRSLEALAVYLFPIRSQQATSNLRRTVAIVGEFHPLVEKMQAELAELESYQQEALNTLQAQGWNVRGIEGGTRAQLRVKAVPVENIIKLGQE